MKKVHIKVRIGKYKKVNMYGSFSRYRVFKINNFLTFNTRTVRQYTYLQEYFSFICYLQRVNVDFTFSLYFIFLMQLYLYKQEKYLENCWNRIISSTKHLI